MLRWNENINYVQEFSQNWNKKLKSIRITSFIVSALLLICSILCMFFPVQSVFVIETIAAILIVAWGIYQIFDYFCSPVFLRDAGSLISSILNIIIGVLLLYAPREMTVSTFAVIFGIVLMVFGINKIAFANKLCYFGIQNYGWVIVSGVLTIIAALGFIILPMIATLVLHYILAAYLLVGGIVLLIEAIMMRDLKIE